MADDLSSLREHSFDPIVLNSTIQYFPSFEYVMTALDEALRVARPGGRLFIGDVRHKGLLNALHASVQLYRADGDMSISELRRRVETAAARDKELAVDPEFFVELAARHPRLTRAHIMPKLAPYDNELNRFRYGVTLDVVGEAGIHATSQHFRPNGTRRIDAGTDRAATPKRRPSTAKAMACSLPAASADLVEVARFSDDMV